MQMISIRPYTDEDWSRISEIHDSARKLELHNAGLTARFFRSVLPRPQRGFSTTLWRLPCRRAESADLPHTPMKNWHGFMSIRTICAEASEAPLCAM